MRTILFFDLPTLTSKNKKAYRDFVKLLKLNGFYMLQESVYVKMSIDQQATDATLARIKAKTPKEGNIIALNITEKQFSSMNILLGETNCDVISSTDRILKL